MESLDAKDSFFVEATGNNHNYASINRTNDATNSTALLLLIEGYREAAFKLLSELTQNHNNDWSKIDSFIYPALYVYRHYLELILKDTLRYYRLLKDEISADQTGFVNQHSLLELWKELKHYLENTVGHEVDSALNRNIAEKLLTEFDNKDKGSFAFRYPFNATKLFTAPATTSLNSFSVDLINLKNTCKKLSNYFEGINWRVAAMLDEK
jgi:hypothetical protein